MLASKYAEPEPASPQTPTRTRLDSSSTETKPLPPLPASVEKASPARSVPGDKEPRRATYTQPMYSTPHSRKISREKGGNRRISRISESVTTTPGTHDTTETSLLSPQTLASSPAADERSPINARMPTASPQATPNLAKKKRTSIVEPGSAAAALGEGKDEQNSATMPPPPPKKLLSGRNKQCIIRIPAEPKEESRRRLAISLSEYASRLKEFENEGYNTRGYDHEMACTKEPDDGLEFRDKQLLDDIEDRLSHLPSNGQNRPIVFIPTKSVWEAYRTDLVEAKLRALGVLSSGEAASADAASISMSRKNSSPFAGLAKSPPPLSASASSQHQWSNSHVFSAPFSPAGFTKNSSVGSAASPVSFVGPMMGPFARPGHLSRQSTYSLGLGNSAINPALQQQYALQQQAQTPPKIGSPLHVGSIPRVPSALARESPNHVDGGQTPQTLDGSNQAAQDVAPRTTRSPAPLPDTAYPEAKKTAAQPSSSSNETPRQPPSRARAESYGLLTQPTPQGHRQNISRSLEREAEKPQYYPGEYVSEGEEQGRSTAGKHDTPTGPAKSQPTTLHKSGGSKSGLNANAKEFQFDPHSAHRRHISIPRIPFMPKSAGPGITTSQPAISLVTAHANGQATRGSTFDVNAPAFQPRAQGKFGFSSAFDFSAKKPQSDAADKVFEPDEEDRDEPKPPGIFGGMDVPNVVKPNNKSEAVSFVKPGASIGHQSDAEPPEDEFGRIKQDTARYKRGRVAREDDNDVPQFATPTSDAPLPTDKQIHEAQDAGSASSHTLPNVSVNHLSESLKAHVLAPGSPSRSGSGVDEEANASWSDYGIESPRRDRSPSKNHTAEKPSETVVSKAAVQEVLAAAQSEAQPFDKSTLVLPLPEKEPAMTSEDVTPSMGEFQAPTALGNARDHSDKGIAKLLDDRAPSLSPSKLYMMQHRGGSQSPDLSERKLTALRGEMTGVQNPAAPVDWLHDQRVLRGIASPIRKLNGNHETEVSDWDDFLSDRDESNFLSQAHFFDTRVRSLIESVLQQHLDPLQRALKDMDGNIKALPVKQSSEKVSKHITEKSSSDADDEEDDEQRPEKTRPPSSSVRSQKKLDNIRAIVLEAIESTRAVSSSDRLDEEIRALGDAEKRADDLQKLLTLSEKEIALYKESSENHDRRVHVLRDEKHHAQERISALEKIERELRAKASGLAAETSAVECTLEEYRKSSTKWQQEIDSIKATREQLQQTIDELGSEVQQHEHTIHRSNREVEAHQDKLAVVTSKLEKAEDTLINATRQLQGERESWRRKDEEQAKNIAVHRARLEEEFKVRQRLERELNRHGVHERNAIKATVSLEEVRSTNARLAAEAAQLRDEHIAEKNAAALHEREATEAKDIARAEIQRNKTLLEAEIEVANKRAENTRTDLETRLAHVRRELETERADHIGTKNVHAKKTDEAHHQRIIAVREASESANIARSEERQRFEQLTADLSMHHDFAMKTALDQQQRSETHWTESLKLSREKHILLEDKIKHLEDKVTVAQSAAQAAATAARHSAADNVKTAAANRDQLRPSERVSPQALRESIVVLQEQLQERETRIETLETAAESTDKDLPAKYHERETEITWLRELLGVRLDDLSELVNLLSLENYDRIAARDAAIRIRANLQMEQQEKERLMSGGTTNPLSIGRGVDMARQATNPLPSLSDIQNFTTPKAAQLAAAWGNWRRGSNATVTGMGTATNSPAKPSLSSSLRDAVNGSASTTATPSRQRTAQRPHPGYRSDSGRERQNNINGSGGAGTSSAQTFLSGLMTPPASNMRRTPVSQQAPSRGSRDDGDYGFSGAAEGDDIEEEQDRDYDDGDSGAGDAQPLSLDLELADDASAFEDNVPSQSQSQSQSPSRNASASGLSPNQSRSRQPMSANGSPQKPRQPSQQPSQQKQSIQGEKDERTFADDERAGARPASASDGAGGIGEVGAQTASGTQLQPFGEVL